MLRVGHSRREPQNISVLSKRIDMMDDRMMMDNNTGILLKIGFNMLMFLSYMHRKNDIFYAMFDQ
jgi:hypothetical protein